MTKTLYLTSRFILRLISKSILIGVVAIVLFSCTKETEDETAIEHPSVSKELSVKVVYGANALTCDNEFIHQNILWQAQSLGFFMSDFEMREEQSNSWKKIRLSVNNWQTSNTALLWFAANCGAKDGFNKSLALNLPLHSEQSFSDIAQIRFSLSVPFEANHANPLTQPSPINLPEMFWSWRLGHKFLRIDMAAIDQVTDISPWFFHLGSTGCTSASSLRAPETECEQSNRNTYTIDVGENAANFLKLDLKVLLDGVKPNEESSCMFKADQVDACKHLLENLSRPSLFTFAKKSNQNSGSSMPNDKQAAGQ